VFFMLVAACPMLHRFSGEAVGSVLLLPAVYALFGGYQRQDRATGAMFYAFVFLGLGSLLFARMVLFVPLFVLAAYYLRALTWRSLLGGVVGLALPCWLLLAYALWRGDMALFCRPLERMVTFTPLLTVEFQPWEWGVLGYLLVVYLVCMSHLLMSGYEGKVSTRSYLMFFGWLCLYVFVYLVLQPGDVTQMLPFLLLGSSVLVSHYMATAGGTMSNLLFFAAWMGLFCLYSYNVVKPGWIS
jgi:hypothetical protein